MKKNIFLIGLCISLVVGLFTIPPVFAENTTNKALEQLNAGSAAAGYGTDAADPRIVASKAIMAFVGLLGVIVTYLFVLAGYYFVSSHGNDEKVSKARKIMQGAVIGLIIVLLSYSIAYFLGRAAQDAVGLNSTGVPQQYK